MESATPETGTLTLSSGQTLRASIRKNTFFGVARGLVHMSARFVVVPFIIKTLGVEGYGIWAVLMTIAAYMTLGGAGVLSAFQKYVAEATGSGDYDRASRLLSTGSALLLLISIVLLVPMAVFSRTLAVMVGIPSSYIATASRAICLMSITAVVTNFFDAYQAILLGAHRIDLREQLGIVLEAASVGLTIALLHFGYGLLAMTAVFCGSLLCSNFLSYLLSRNVLPMLRLAPRFVTRSVLRELLRYAGSYQLVSVIEAVYAAILPIYLLKFFGARATGVVAIATRVASAAALAQGAFLQSILSGGSWVYASRSSDGIRTFIVKSFNAMWAISIIPLAFVAINGPTIVTAWTGQTDPLFRVAFWLVSAAALFRSLSSLARVLYRTSGGALMDNAQLFLMLAIMLLLFVVAPKVGLAGILTAAALAQGVGMVFMCAVLSTRVHGFSIRMLLPDFLKFGIASTAILICSQIVCYVPMHWSTNARLLAAGRIGIVSSVSLAVAFPALLLTGSISRSEGEKILTLMKQKLHFGEKQSG